MSLFNFSIYKNGFNYFRIIQVVSILLAIIILSGCSAQRKLESLSKLQFKIDTITDFEILGIPISGKSQLGDFSPTEILKLVPAFARGKLPTYFTINVKVKNPNVIEGATDDLNIEIVSLPWDFYFNGKKILKGNISEPIKFHGNKTYEMVPIKIYVNIFELINEDNISEFLSAILDYGGQNPSTSKMSLYAKPVVATILGNISYPEPVKIVDYEFSGK
jgi:hypothetical protein